eukprot:symbB.v1.2.036349.t1/scaffold5111.1/size30776/5
MIAKLTAENLRKFAAAQAAQQEAAGGAKKASSFGSGGFARSATLNTADRQKADEAITPHGVPRNWQVSVRKQLRKGLSGKDLDDPEAPGSAEKRGWWRMSCF